MSDSAAGGNVAAGRQPGPEDEIIVECSVAAPAARVWSALTDPGLRSRWWPGLALEAVPGAALRECWIEDGAERVADGIVGEVVSRELLRFSWADAAWEAPTTVAIRLVSSGRATLVRVVESGLSRLSNAREVADAHQAGWAWHLEQLREFAESG